MREKTFFETIPPKTLMQLNTASVVITLLCELFVIYTFLTKGQQQDIEKWKYLSILGALILVSLLLAGSVFSFLFFLKYRRKNRR